MNRFFSKLPQTGIILTVCLFVANGLNQRALHIILIVNYKHNA